MTKIGVYNMADCTDFPTPEDAKRFKNNAGSVNEFVTSDSDTFVDQDGGEHITITGIDELAEVQRDQFDTTFHAQFAYKRIGNISDYAGESLPETDKLNSYQFPDDSGNWYGPIQSQAFPIIIPADPSVDNGWVLVNAVTSYSLAGYVTLQADSVADMKRGTFQSGSIDLTSGMTVSTRSYRNLSPSDTFGASNYLIMTVTQYGGTPDEYGDHTLDNGNVAKLIRKNPEVSQFGAWDSDPSKDSTPAFMAAHNATTQHGVVNAVESTYYTNIENWTRGIIGYDVKLKRFDDSTPAAINFGSFAPNWRYKPVFGIVFDGDSNPTENGEGATIGYPSDAIAGRWGFANISVINCTKGIRKYAGNIGCSFDNYHFQYNDYGFFAEDSSGATAMHTGADTWGVGHIESSAICGVYYKDGTSGYGGHKFNPGMIVEGNPGFGIVLRCTNAVLVPFNEPDINGVWMEKNASATSVELDDLGSIEPKNIYAINIKGMSINSHYMFNSKFENSKVSGDSVRLDSDYTANPEDIEIDSTSVMNISNAIARTNGRIRATVTSYKEIPNFGGIAAGGMVSFALMRNLISADGSGVAKNFNSINASSPINSTGTSTIPTVPVTPGFIGEAAHELTIPAGNTQFLGGNSSVTSGKYFVATINVRLKNGITDDLSSAWTGGSGSLGSILIDRFNPKNWRCSISIGKGSGQSGVQARFVNNGSSPVTVSVCDLQIVEFDFERDAINYANNLLFTQV